MSVFLGGQSTLTNQLLQDTDSRVQQPDYQWDFNGRGVQVKPWADGMLWPRSRMGGADVGGALLGNDYQSFGGRFEADAAEVSGGQQQKKIIGTSRDSIGSPLGSCRIEAFLTAGDVPAGTCTSDSGGYFVCCTPYPGAHYIVAYKAGSPDQAGTTVNTIIPV